MADTYQRNGNSLIFMGSDSMFTAKSSDDTTSINKNIITVVPKEFDNTKYFVENTYIERVDIPTEIKNNKTYIFKSPFDKNRSAITQSFLYVNNKWIDATPICDNGMFYGLKCLIYGDGYMYINTFDKLIHPKYSDIEIYSTLWKIVLYG